MTKKTIIILCISFVLILSIAIILILTKDNKYSGDAFYLDDEYYGSGQFIESDFKSVEQLIDNKSTFLLFVYNNYCSLPISCETIFQEGIKQYKINAFEITFENLKNTSIYDTVKLAPSFIIIKDGKIIDYLKADDDDDLDKYQDVDAFKSWLNKYIIVK